MSDPDAIRADIERTRAELSGNVDALADKVTPSKVVHRQTDKVKGAFSSAKESLMGTVHDATDSVTGGISGGASSVGDAGRSAATKAKGNPLAVGLIAFAEWLVASLLPGTETEKHAAAEVKQKAQPLVEKASEAAKEAAGNLKEPAQNAAQSVKETATDAAQNVKQEATSAADDVKSSTQDAASDVRPS